jgi:uncharacterized protein HemX
VAELDNETGLSEKYKSQKSRGGLWFGIFILIVVIVIAAAEFYFLQQLRSEQTDLGGEVNKGDMQLLELTKQINGYQSQLAALSSHITNKDDHFNKVLSEYAARHDEKLNTTQKQINESMQQIQRQLGKTRSDWLVADAEYLLTIANERLHLAGDLNTTREALEAADQRLRESGDAGVFKVREEIVRELGLIKNLVVPDIVGMYSSIQGIQKQVDKLTLQLPFAGKVHKQESEITTQNETETSALDKLKGLVTVRHTEHSIEKILTAEEAIFIHEELKVKLEMVKIALVERNEQLFSSSLEDAKSWISQHFIVNSASTGMIEELDKLAAIKLNSHYPDISQSLKMLADISKLRIEADKDLPAKQPSKPVEVPVETTVKDTPAKETPVKDTSVKDTPPAPDATDKPVEVKPVQQ